jgi:hypothetical protein
MADAEAKPMVAELNAAMTATNPSNQDTILAGATAMDITLQILTKLANQPNITEAVKDAILIDTVRLTEMNNHTIRLAKNSVQNKVRIIDPPDCILNIRSPRHTGGRL